MTDTKSSRLRGPLMRQTPTPAVPDLFQFDTCWRPTGDVISHGISRPPNATRVNSYRFCAHHDRQQTKQKREKKKTGAKEQITWKVAYQERLRIKACPLASLKASCDKHGELWASFPFRDAPLPNLPGTKRSPLAAFSAKRAPVYPGTRE